MNVSIVYKANVKDGVLDDLARELPVIIAKTLEVPGGRVAIIEPGQVSLEFSPASVRDVGSDIRIMIFARSNDPRTSSENDLARAVLEKVIALISTAGEKYSVNTRIYLMEIGVAERTMGN